MPAAVAAANIVAARKLSEGDRLVRRPEAAKMVGLSVSTFEADASRPRLGIPTVRLGRAVLYRISDLEAWVERNTTYPKQTA